ncbi:permease [Nocardia yunnanensis]|uniref:Permease n=1 Tax=Nocardia yunnanensis TaxID=2382165 RepID=A0A386ZM01_9NOCA|nr:permease [Nocardia yunnanensis]AYF78194.1 permease [Nocardia yunnanensis]
MTTPSIESSEGKRSSFVTWRNRIIAGVIALVVLWLAYLILAAFIPRWWAQRIAEMVGSSFAKGIWYGLLMGLLCTAVPLFLLLTAGLSWRKRGGRFIAGAAAVLALIAAIPNLMTLTIVLGDSNAAHAGQRILDVDGPGFRGAVLVGAIVAAVLFAAAAFLLVRRRFRRHRADRRRVEPEKPRVSPETPANPPELGTN